MANNTRKLAPVSVVIPCYRCSETIKRAVQSIAAQTVLPSEVILIDDASPDDTPDHLCELQREYPDGWIKLLSQPVNRGPSAARNRGWNMATGDYVAFLDSDDSWHPRKIELQYSWMRRAPDAVYSSHNIQFRTNDDLAESAASALRAKSITKLPLLLRNITYTSTVMIRRDTELRFDEAKKRSEDYLLWLRIVLGGGKAYLLSPALASSYKFPFGDGGLTGPLLAMQLGQLDTYRRVYRQGLISRLLYMLALTSSGLRFARRLVVRSLRRMRFHLGRRRAPVHLDHEGL